MSSSDPQGGQHKGHCLTCKVDLFTTSDLLAHFRSLVHQLNLTRSISGLEPVSQNEFDKMCIEKETESFPCESCNQSFDKKEKLDRHRLTRAHIQRIQKNNRRLMSTKQQTRKRSVGLKNPGAMRCFICRRKSISAELNYEHMNKSHRFEICFIADVKSLEAFLKYLGTKIYEGHQCIRCNRRKDSLSGTLNHMQDADHFSIINPIPQFYRQFYKEELESDGEYLSDDEDPFRMTLSSGYTIGHRFLLPYYRQRLRRPLAKSKAVQSIESSSTKDVAQSKRIDLNQLQIIRKWERRSCVKWARSSVRLALKQNRFQKHFRPQVVF